MYGPLITYFSFPMSQSMLEWIHIPQQASMTDLMAATSGDMNSTIGASSAVPVIRFSKT